MIITKTPFRISFFGGGTDYPEWYKKYGGEVISTTIDKYVYISVRKQPHFFDHKFRIVYSKDEKVKTLNEIKHKPVREILKYLKINNGLQIHCDTDLPARSGVGSSSAFVVGLLHTLLKIKKKKINKKILASRSIFLETKILKETVGSQDQVACAYGGFNNIKFRRNGEFHVQKVNLSNRNIQTIENNLFLVFSKIQRTAEVVAKSFVNKLCDSRYKEMQKIKEILDEAKNNLKDNNINNFGKLLHESWLLKKDLSNKISNIQLDDLYNHAIDGGATGGKLLGAGGGGFFVFYVEKKNHKKFLNKMKKTIVIPFKFEKNGSHILSNTYKDY